MKSSPLLRHDLAYAEAQNSHLTQASRAEAAFSLHGPVRQIELESIITY